MQPKKPTAPWVDPIVEEIHQIRAEMMREAGGDFHVYCANIRKSQEKHGDRLVHGPLQKLVIPPDMLAPTPLSDQPR